MLRVESADSDGVGLAGLVGVGVPSWLGAGL